MHCDSNPTHAPAVGTFRTTSNGDAVEMPLCDDCLRHRITAGLDNGEGFTVSTILARDFPPYPSHLMSDL
jgi:hypothetical protein